MYRGRYYNQEVDPDTEPRNSGDAVPCSMTTLNPPTSPPTPHTKHINPPLVTHKSCLNPQLSTVHPKISTLNLNPNPSTPNPKVFPDILHVTVCQRNPKQETLICALSTFDSVHQTPKPAPSIVDSRLSYGPITVW